MKQYTWWNGRENKDYIYKRLDRILTNHQIQSTFPVIEIEHLLRSGLDHEPMLITLKKIEELTKTFRFRNF